MLAFLFNPSGRIGRAKWWLAQLVALAVGIIVFLMLIGLTPVKDQRVSDTDFILALAVIVLAIVLVWMSFCATAKRYHDRNKSAWWYLIQFIPFIGSIWQFVELGFCSGDDGENDYGTGPGFDIRADIENLRKAKKPDEEHPAVPAYQTASTRKNSGRPVFGKRG